MRIIDADAYAEHLENALKEIGMEVGLKFLVTVAVTAAIISDLRNEEITPTVDIDMGVYSDQLWKLAYERGKKEGRLEGGKE